MPLSAPHPCGHPSCPELVRGARFCAGHQQQHEAADRARRGSSTERGYDADWRRVRDQVLRAHPLCVLCLDEGVVTAATVGDHIVSVKVAPERRLDPTNVRPLCERHHNQRTDEGDFGRSA